MTKHIHILGICGTFMGSVAALAKASGYRVSGCDQNVYPPMSTQLEKLDIELTSGYHADSLPHSAECIVVGNALSRGNEAVEQMLNRGLAHVSGPQWVAENILHDRWVLAVAGTHGKTTTASILAWILDFAGLNPAFLIGGVAQNFGVTARLTDSKFFVIEADEYDSAFFDKRSKFIHYHPRTIILNNLEFDHADIFPDLGAIKRQFHHLVRTVPGHGLIIWNRDSLPLSEVLEMGCWSEGETLSAEPGDADWYASLTAGFGFDVHVAGKKAGSVQWDQIGEHNTQNALAAIAAARHVGVPIPVSIAALREFKGVKRRLEEIGRPRGIVLYDDFAHHPTAIRATLAALRMSIGDARLVAILEPRSNTMKMGAHGSELAQSLSGADVVRIYQPPGLNWDLQGSTTDLDNQVSISQSMEDLQADLLRTLKPGDHAVIMSNGGFGGLHQKLLRALDTAS